MIRVPALHGDDPLGFLAAIGLLSLSEHQLLPDLRLSWSTSGSPIAQVEGSRSLEELAAQLDSAFEQVRADGAPLPGGLPDFPPLKKGTAGSDPIRVLPKPMASHFKAAEDAEGNTANPWPARWLIGLATQISQRPKGDVELTPFYAPTGQMTLRSSILDAPQKGVQQLGGPSDALTGWQRVAFDGANYDHRAVRDGAIATNGTAANRGAPSPTWLAVMGLSFFPMVDTPSGAKTVGWQRIRLYDGYTNRSIIWPIWSPPLDAASTRVLLAHQSLQLDGPRPLRRDSAFPVVSELRGLGVFSLFGSSRRTRSQGDGPLGPAVRVWPR
ncbi:MAG: type I-G CRISPR-associated protein, Cas3-extension family [Acidimicrobiia bacterium]